MRTIMLILGMTLTLVLATMPMKSEAVVTVREAAQYVAGEQVHGPLYAKYKKKYSKALDWDNNGCSIPNVSGEIQLILNKYGEFWQNSCDRHDFSYRNNGKHGFGRKLIDKIFYENMKQQCDEDNAPGWPESAAEQACVKAASGFHQAVRAGGGSSWD